VWVVPNYPWDGDPVSGIFYRNQATALARTGADVTVIAPTPYAPWPLGHITTRWQRYRRAPRTQLDEGVSVLRPRYPAVLRDARWARPDVAASRAAWGTRSAWLDRAGLVHGHFAVAAIAAGLLSRRARLPYLVTVHGDDINTWPYQRPEWRAALTRTLREASAVVAVSAALAEAVRDLAGVPALALPLGIRHAAFRAAAAGDRDDLRRRAGVPDGSVAALFVGNLIAPKGILEFVEGVRLAGAPIHGLVVGEGPARRELERRGLERVRWLGSMPNDAVARVMHAADLLVLPSHGEGLPTAVVEAGSLGLPVIGSRVGGIPELLGEGRGYLLSEITGTAVASALREAASDRGGASRRGAALRAHVEAWYDVDRNASRLGELYRDVAERRAPRVPSSRATRT
jgi:teichuronic acid biosynthesis glycosyltransferase TuaC